MLFPKHPVIFNIVHTPLHLSGCLSTLMYTGHSQKIMLSRGPRYFRGTSITGRALFTGPEGHDTVSRTCPKRNLPGHLHRSSSAESYGIRPSWMIVWCTGPDDNGPKHIFLRLKINHEIFKRRVLGKQSECNSRKNNNLYVNTNRPWRWH